MENMGRMSSGLAMAEARCRRICGEFADCTVADARQLRCLCEAVTERAARISDTLVHAYAVREREKLLLNVDGALAGADDLITGMRYLQLTGDLRKFSSLRFDPAAEKRRETRYPLPRAYRDHIALDVGHEGAKQRASILNFSKGGVQFQCPEPIPGGARLNCILTTSRALGQSQRFSIRVKYIMEQERGFIVGGQVEELADGPEANFCKSVFDFMMDLSL